MTFDELNLTGPLRNAISEMGLVNTTPIQREAFNLIASGKDVVGVAQTGTGKTIAYLLPILRHLKFSKQNTPRILILVPTRELVVQVVEEAEKLCAYMNVRIAGVYGGTNINTQKIAVMQGLDVIVATPGRLMDLAFHGALKLKHIKQLVIDEVDEMLQLGFRPQLTNILDTLPERRQNLLFSATLSPELDDLIETFFNHPTRVEIAPTGTPLEQISQQGYSVPNFNTKVNLAIELLKDEEAFNKVLIFIGTKKLADRLFDRLTEHYPGTIGVIHSNKSQNYRLNSVKGFDAGDFRMLIATDLISRGLDFDEVSHVLNFDVPENAVDYIHRIGRTGRADKEGVAITFVGHEKETDKLLAVQDLMGMELPLQELPEGVAVSKKLIPEEQEQVRMRNYLPETKLKNSGGAFHEKKLKNQKVNRIAEKKKARRDEMRSWNKRKGGNKKKR